MTAHLLLFLFFFFLMDHLLPWGFVDCSSYVIVVSIPFEDDVPLE